MLLGAKPVLIDIDLESYCMDVDQLESKITTNTKAIVPVHLFGQPANMAPINEIAKRHEIVVIEDNAQAIGAKYEGNKTGSIGDIGCLSFYPSKNLGAMGDGGMVVTSNKVFAEKIKLLRTQDGPKNIILKSLGITVGLTNYKPVFLE